MKSSALEKQFALHQIQGINVVLAQLNKESWASLLLSFLPSVAINCINALLRVAFSFVVSLIPDQCTPHLSSALTAELSGARVRTALLLRVHVLSAEVT